MKYYRPNHCIKHTYSKCVKLAHTKKYPVKILTSWHQIYTIENEEEEYSKEKEYVIRERKIIKGEKNIANGIGTKQ